jgi:hypothetical protein
VKKEFTHLIISPGIFSSISLFMSCWRITLGNAPFIFRNNAPAIFLFFQACSIVAISFVTAFIASRSVRLPNWLLCSSFSRSYSLAIISAATFSIILPM